MSNNVPKIKARFIEMGNQDGSDGFECISTAVHALMKDQGMSLKDANHQVIGWAVEAGFIPEPLKSLAEEQARSDLQAAE